MGTTNTSSTTIEDGRRIAAMLAANQTGLRARIETYPCRVASRQENGRVAWVDATGARMVFDGGSAGSHSVDLAVSSEARILAHWQGYCEANGAEPFARYLVTVEGSMSYNDGWDRSRVLVTGWVAVEAPIGATEREIKGLARRRADSASWECEGNVRYLRAVSIEGDSN